MDNGYSVPFKWLGDEKELYLHNTAQQQGTSLVTGPARAVEIGSGAVHGASEGQPPCWRKAV